MMSAPEIATKIVVDKDSSTAVPICTEKGSARQAEPFLVLCGPIRTLAE